MSPARSHVEQSRNTLLFASCAKEVSTNPQVNTIMSDKALVKHLQRELDRLENELKTPRSNHMVLDTDALLREKDLQMEEKDLQIEEKDLQIEKMQKQIEDLMVEQDIARSQVQDLLHLVGNNGNSLIRLGTDDYPHLRVQISPESETYMPQTSIVEHPPRSFDGSIQTFGSSRYSPRSSFNENYVRVPEFEDNSPPLRPMIRVAQSETDSCHDWDDIDDNKSNETSHEPCKVVRCIENKEELHPKVCIKSFCSSPVSPKREFMSPNSIGEIKEPPLMEDEDQPMEEEEEEERQLESNDIELEEFPRRFKLPKSRSCKEITCSTWFDKLENENTPPNGYEKYYTGRPECLASFKNGVDFETGCCSCHDRNGNEEDILSISSFKSVTKESAETQNNKQIEDTQIIKTNCTKSVKDIGLDPIEDCIRLTSWPLEFKRLQKEIVELWHDCNVSLVHRTYFFLLFNGDPTDSIYMEVERRRLTFLKGMFARVNMAVDDGRTITCSSAEKALRRERQMLTKQMQKKLLEHERESLFLRWGIGLNTKYRRIQLANQLWTKVDDMDHVADSAVVVAKLIGLITDPVQAPKEMFGLNFTPPPSRKSYSFKRSLVPLL